MLLEEDFLAAICAAPDDDGPRLVYADWLDEHGDPRGEFIRVQLALANLAEDNPSRERLEARERQLLVDNEARWLGPLRACGVERWRFHRGLVESIHLPFDAFLRRGSELFRHAPVMAVRLIPDGGSLATLAQQSGLLASVRRLDLSDWGLADQGLRQLLGSPLLGRIEALVLRSAGLTGTGVATLAHAGLLSLRHLDLSHNPLADNGVARLAALECLDGLDELVLRSSGEMPFYDRIHARGAAWLAESNLRKLWRLDLSGNGIGDAGLAALARSPVSATLVDLDVSQNEVGLIGDAGYEGLVTSPHLGSLRRLVLSDNPIGPAGAAALARWPRLAGLVRLELDRCSIGDAGAVSLAMSEGLRGLAELRLRGNRIGTRGAVVLAVSNHLGPRTLLDLRDNPIDEDHFLLRGRVLLGPVASELDRYA